MAEQPVPVLAVIDGSKPQIPVWRACDSCRSRRRRCIHKHPMLLPLKTDGLDASPRPIDGYPLSPPPFGRQPKVVVKGPPKKRGRKKKQVVPDVPKPRPRKRKRIASNEEEGAEDSEGEWVVESGSEGNGGDGEEEEIEQPGGVVDGGGGGGVETIKEEDDDMYECIIVNKRPSLTVTSAANAGPSSPPGSSHPQTLPAVELLTTPTPLRSPLERPRLSSPELLVESSPPQHILERPSTPRRAGTQGPISSPLVGAVPTGHTSVSARHHRTRRRSSSFSWLPHAGGISITPPPEELPVAAAHTSSSSAMESATPSATPEEDDDNPVFSNHKQQNKLAFSNTITPTDSYVRGPFGHTLLRIPRIDHVSALPRHHRNSIARWKDPTRSAAGARFSGPRVFTPLTQNRPTGGLGLLVLPERMLRRRREVSPEL